MKLVVATVAILGAFTQTAFASTLPGNSEAHANGLVNALLSMSAMGSTWVLYLLIALSVSSLGVIFERASFFFMQKANLGALTQRLHKLLAADDWTGAEGLCKESRSFEASVALLALEQRDNVPEAAQKTVESYVAAQKRHLDKGLTFLGTLGNNAPFIGLFGTVLGIIEAFHALALNPAGGANVVMSGISESLVATAVGLAVAIPAVIAFNTFQRIVKNKLESASALHGLVSGHAVSRSHNLKQSHSA